MYNLKLNRFNIKRDFIGIIKHILFIILCIITLFPLYFILNTSFKSKIEFIVNKISIPKIFTFENYITAFRGKAFLLWTLSTLILTLGTIVLSTIAAILISYVIAKRKFPGREKILNFIICLMLVSPIVIIIPLFVLFTEIKLINNYIGLILIYSGLVLPFSIYMLTSFFKTIPNSLIEAAHIDGCTDIGIIFKIITPLSSAPIITLIIVNALYVWSEFIFALTFLQSDKLKTLMVGISIYQSRYALNVPVIMAGMTLATIPMIILYICGQKFFIRGVIAGSSKE